MGLVAALMVSTVSGGTSDDAGTGQDAGNSVDTALVLSSFGGYAGHLTGQDEDWYAVNSNNGPVCVSVDASGDTTDGIHLGVEGADGRRKVGSRLKSGSSETLAIATPSLTKTLFGIRPLNNISDPLLGNYQFALLTTGIPSPSAGDAMSGTDAGSTTGGALPVTTSCLGGNLAPVLGSSDNSDVYSFSAKAGEVITYSLASAPATPARASLLGTSGVLLQDSITSGGITSYSVPTSGTYFVEISRASGGSADTGYVLGIVVGPPEPPGSGCRPYC